jgi:rRNA maturation RNase YbeY
MSIRFFSEGIDFKVPHPRKTTAWIRSVILKERKQLHSLNYIFCDDSYLLRMNQQYLNHKTLTDIITFDYSEKNKIAGEIFISLERVSENARKYSRPLDEELHRVIIHGVLHLAGYKDKKPSEKALMRKKEQAYLSLRS